VTVQRGWASASNCVFAATVKLVTPAHGTHVLTAIERSAFPTSVSHPSSLNSTTNASSGNSILLDCLRVRWQL
jgi:hypothetical protein